MTESCWQLWRDGHRSPFLNMAIDELLLSEAGRLAAPLLRIYGWNTPSVSIGYVQNINAAPAEGYAVVRRPTGGGVVYHDRDLTYTAVIPAGHPINDLDRMESYHVFHRAVLLALEKFGIRGALASEQHEPVDRAFMQCFTTPTRYDVVGGEGKKFAGAAQRRTREGILHQGSISLETAGGDVQALTSELIAAFEVQFQTQFAAYQPSAEFLCRAEVLAESKYGRPEWNFDRQVPTTN